jgi:hypothetical protein
MYNARPSEEGVRLAGVGEGHCAEIKSRIAKHPAVIQRHVSSIHKGAYFMTNAKRLTMFGLLAFGTVALAAISWAQSRPPILEQVAKAYGLDSWDNITAIRYTWHAQFPGVDVSRTWTWEPKTNKVTYEGKDKDGKPVTATYLRSQLSSQPENVQKQIDPAFNNDNYWLLFPLHAYWDTGATVTNEGMKKLPIGTGSATLVPVKYSGDGGYTPGDTWDLYIGKDNRVVQFVYHRGGPVKPSVVIATWTGYKKAGGLDISTEHRGTADGKPLHLWMTDVAVKVTGSDAWVDAK